MIYKDKLQIEYTKLPHKDDVKDDIQKQCIITLKLSCSSQVIPVEKL